MITTENGGEERSLNKDLNLGQFLTQSSHSQEMCYFMTILFDI